MFESEVVRKTSYSTRSVQKTHWEFMHHAEDDWLFHLTLSLFATLYSALCNSVFGLYIHTRINIIIIVIAYTWHTWHFNSNIQALIMHCQGTYQLFYCTWCRETADSFQALFQDAHSNSSIFLSSKTLGLKLSIFLNFQDFVWTPFSVLCPIGNKDKLLECVDLGRSRIERSTRKSWTLS